MNENFLTYFPGHAFRYIDSTGNGRPAKPCSKIDNSLNLKGYESYFTVNGFSNSTKATKTNCTNLNSFFVDIDGRKDLEELESIKAKFDPSFINETKRGYHLYWLLDETIYKADYSDEEWNLIVARWERIEQAIVIEFNADPVVKDVSRILRVPGTFYWKKTGDLWKEGTEKAFVIKTLYENISSNYSMNEIEEILAIPEITSSLTGVFENIFNEKETKEKTVEFFNKLNEEFPVKERDSFNKLISNNPDSLIPSVGRNNTLHITACLMRQGGYTMKEALDQINEVGWHGMESENGGPQEIINTIKSAFSGNYTYSDRNEVIVHNMTPAEKTKMVESVNKVSIIRKKEDKARFDNYEYEFLEDHPYFKKRGDKIIFDYRNGVYKMMLDEEIMSMMINSLHNDMLRGFKTPKNVNDKIACLRAIIPELEITDDKGYIANIKNGLLNIYTKELLPHTPYFVSLIQYPVEYNPKAKCPNWDKCVSDWMSGPEQEDKTRLVQQFCGYCLSSSMNYDKALFIVGDGGNGKSTFVDTIGMVLGKEATSHIDLEGIYGDFGMAGLIGKRLNIIEEVQGNYYQSNKLKKLISGEEVTINIKYKSQFTFKPQVKFMFSVNLLPRVDDTSNATERRILCLQFLNNYRKNPNYELRSSAGLLAQELSGVLNWMIEGAIDLNDSKEFIMTREQNEMLEEYREENSSVEGFLADCVIPSEDEYVDSPDLYREYQKWSVTDGGRKPKSNATFTKEVKAYIKRTEKFTFESRVNGKSDSKFIGITLTPEWLKRRQQTGLRNNY